MCRPGPAEVDGARPRPRLPSALPARRDLPQQPGQPDGLAEGVDPHRVPRGRRGRRPPRPPDVRAVPVHADVRARRPASGAARSCSKVVASTSSRGSARTPCGGRCCPSTSSRRRRQGSARVPEDARARRRRRVARDVRARDDRLLRRDLLRSAESQQGALLFSGAFPVHSNAVTNPLTIVAAASGVSESTRPDRIDVGSTR